jgi:hypothetical protein
VDTLLGRNGESGPKVEDSLSTRKWISAELWADMPDLRVPASRSWSPVGCDPPRPGMPQALIQAFATLLLCTLHPLEVLDLDPVFLERVTDLAGRQSQ